MSYFEYVTPESQGMDSGKIVDLINDLDRKGIEMHRLMILRNGKCVAKGCYAPYEENDLHPVYSFTKSLTSTAIGLAIQEEKLKLTDRMVDIMADYLPEDDDIDPESRKNLEKVTVRDLLTMSCGHYDEICTEHPGWIQLFFTHPYPYEPGTFFQYNTAGTNMLSAILTEATGEDLTEYLRPRLFEPLGFGEVFCYRLDNPYRTEHGGGGMKLTLEDMAKFTYFMSQNGCWEGKAILPGWYEQMGIKQIETAGDKDGHTGDWAQGYGYQCWMCQEPGSYRADGAFGQFGMVFPEQNLCFIMNAATEQTQMILDSVHEYLIPACVSDTAIPDSHVKQVRLNRTLEGLHLRALSGSRNPMTENEISKLTYKVVVEKEGCSSLECIIGGAGIRKIVDDSDITEMTFEFTDDSVLWNVVDGGTKKTVKASFEHKFIRTPVKLKNLDVEVAATACWRSRRALEMEIRRMDAMSGVRLIFRFGKDCIDIEADETLITDGGLGMVDRFLEKFDLNGTPEDKKKKEDDGKCHCM